LTVFHVAVLFPRGIGKAISEQFNNNYTNESTILLLARDLDALNQLKQILITKTNNLNKIEVVQIDFSIQYGVEQYVSILKSAINVSALSEFEELYVVYNHATLEHGSINQAAQEDLRKKFEINLFSVWLLVSAINILIPGNIITKQYHVNMSSIYAYDGKI
jgi:short-subunit dehydrogenase